MQQPSEQSLYRVIELEAKLPSRPLNNFRFIRHESIFTRARRLNFDADRTTADFALAAFMDMPDVFEAAGVLGYLGSGKQREVVSVKVYSPFDLGTSGIIRPLDSRVVIGDDAGNSMSLVDMSSHSANPLFSQPT